MEKILCSKVSERKKIMKPGKNCHKYCIGVSAKKLYVTPQSSLFREIRGRARGLDW